jgi:hypothetical protein
MSKSSGKGTSYGTQLKKGVSTYYSSMQILGVLGTSTEAERRRRDARRAAPQGAHNLCVYCMYIYIYITYLYCYTAVITVSV